MSTAMTPAPKQTTAVTPFNRMKNWLESPSCQSAIAKALPRHMTPDRFLRVAVTAMMKTPKLVQCTRESMINCLLQLSQYGLEPDGRNAHLIPFDVRRDGKVIRTDCTLILDYKGMVDLVMRTGLVSTISAEVVCDHDVFEYDRGQLLKHEINFRKPRGKAYAAYANIRFKDGSEKCEVMSQEEIYAIRDRSQGWIAFKRQYVKQSPWNPADPYIEYEMWKKTAFRRVTKWIQLSVEIRGAVENVRHDEPLERIPQHDPAIDEDVNALIAQGLQDDEETNPQHEPEQNGEQSQVTATNAGEESQEPLPEKTLTDADRAVLISAAIKAACDNDQLMNLDGETSLIENDEIRIRLYDEIKARRVIVTGFTGNPNRGKLV